MYERVLQITPKGVAERKKTFPEWKETLVNDFHRVQFIVRAELKARVFDKALGQLWLLLEPIIMAGLYYFISCVIFASGVGSARENFLFIFTAVTFWRWFSKSIDNSPNALVGYASVLKQSNFPIYLVLVSFLTTELFSWFMSFLVLMAFLTLNGFYPNVYYLYLPLVILTQFSITLCLTLVFSVLGTFIKDLSGILYALTSIWWYLSPGIYSISRIPEKYMPLYRLNPFAHIIPAYRDIFIDKVQPPVLSLCVILVAALFCCALGLRLFKMAKHKFFLFL